MLSRSILRFLCVLCFALFFLGVAALPASAQDDPAFTTASQAYSSYHGGDIDHVDLFSGNLSIDIPLMSYPQKGGKLGLNFALHYQSGPATDTQYCDDTGDCWDQWTSFSHGWAIGPTGTPAVSVSPYYQQDMVSPYCAMGTNPNGSTYPMYCFYENWIQTLDQAVHQLLPVSTANIASATWRAADGSGYVVTTNGTLDSNGTLYSGAGQLLIAGYLANIDGPRNYGQFPTQITDTDGNRIAGNLTTLTNGFTYLTSWADTTGRNIPAPIQDSNLAHCPTVSGQPAVTYAFTWNFPSPNSGTAPVEICIVNLGPEQPNNFPDMEIQSIVLPDGKAWTFDYDATYNPATGQNDTGNLLQVNFPTGGSLSYVWGNGPRICDFWACMGDVVASRTLNPQDGGASETWQYQYSPTGSGIPATLSTTVTDPAGNQAVHTFTDLDTQSNLSYYETNATDYKGSSSSGTPLKSVTTAYQYSTPFNVGWTNQSGWSANPQLASYAMNVFPTRVTTTLMDTGQTSSVNYTYDTAVTFYQPVYGTNQGTYPLPYAGLFSWAGSLGKPTTIQQYNYDGSLIRTTTTVYQFQMNSGDFNANLLNLPYSVNVAGAGIGSTAYFGYDENNGSPQCACGNVTSIHTWLNDATAATSNCPVSVSHGYLTSYNVYNTDGTLAKSVDACGSGPTDTNHMTTFGYSSSSCPSGQGFAGTGPTSVTDPLGETTLSCYDLNTGLATSVKDPNDVANGKSTTTTYDYMLRASQISYPDGGLTTYCYGDEPGGSCSQSAPPYQVTVTDKTTSSLTKTETAVLDGLGRVKQKIISVPPTTCPNGYAYADTAYDLMGRVYSVSNPDCTATASDDVVSKTLYDALGRTCLFIPQDFSGTVPTSCPTSAVADTIFTSYSGNCTTVTDEAGKTRKSCSDALGRLTDVWEDPNSLNYHTAYTYDVLGDLLSVSQGGSHNRTFVYDSLKHLVQSTNPEAGTVCYGTLSGSTCQNNGYDADGNLVEKTDARSIAITYAYDYLNRMTGRTYSNGDPSVSYSYGTSTGSGCPGSQPSYNIGRRIGMTDAGGSESFAYDPMGRECTEQRTTNSITKTTSYTYNLDGSLATLTYPSGRMITYTPNIDGAPISAADLTNGITYASNAVYAPQGGLSSLTQGANLVSTLFYNARLQPCRIAATAGATSPTSCSDATNTGNILDLAYNFSSGTANNGDVYGITNNRDITRSQTFTYDNLNRIATGYSMGTHATNATMCWGEQFTYDQWANMTAIGSSGSSYTGCTQDNLSTTADGNNRLAALTYDAAGNVATDGTNTYAWNAESEQKTGNGVNYTYDGDGNRLQKSNGKIYWYGAGTEILDESDNSGNITNEYVFFGGKRVAMDTITGGSIGSTYYYAEDFLGSSRAMVQAGATTACFDADFLPFGREKDNIATCTQNDYKFEGKERDAETGNDDFGARYYSSNFGRWLSPDWSSTPAPVPYANLTNPQTLNLYAMVEDDPESFADLDGHQSAQSDPNVHAGQTGCNLDTGNGCPELALLVIGGNGMAHSLGVGEVLEEIGELIALQDHGQFTIADLGISDPAKAQQKSAQKDKIPAQFVILQQKTQNMGSFSYFFYQLQNKEGVPLKGNGYGVEEHISPEVQVTTSEGRFAPVIDGVLTDIVGLANFVKVGGISVPTSLRLDPEIVDSGLYFQTFTVQYKNKNYNLPTVFVHTTTILPGSLILNSVADITPGP